MPPAQDFYSYSEPQLIKMRATAEKQLVKFAADFKTIRQKIEETEKKKNLIQDALIAKWREPSQSLLEAIEAVKNGEVDGPFETIEQAKTFLAQ